jgi:hypothetical protein
MAISSEYLHLISAGIYSIALFYTTVTFRRTKRLDQIASLDAIMNDLRELDRELTQIPQGSQFDDPRSTLYFRTFNTLDWLSFLIIEKVVVDRKLIEHSNRL